MGQVSYAPEEIGRPERLLPVVMLYALVAGIWITVSDLLLNTIVSDSRQLAQLQVVKGWLFVIVTTVAFYFSLRQGARRIRHWRDALRASQEAYAAFLNASPDLMFELARDGTFTGYRSAPMGLNMPAERFMGRRVQDVLPQLAPKAMPAIEQALATGEVQTFDYELPLDGEPHFYEARIVKSSPQSVIAIIRDVTEQRRTVAALRESEATNRSLLAALPDTMIRVHRDGTYLDVHSPTPELLVGGDRVALIGKRVGDVLPPDIAGLVMHHVRRGLETRQIQVFEYPLRVPAGERYFEARLACSQPDEVLMIIRDVTQRKHAEREREQFLRQMAARLNELATVAEVSLQATTILDRDRLLSTVVQLTRDNFELYHAHIFLVEGDYLVLAAGAGHAGREMVASGYRIPIDHERSVVARAARLRQIVTVRDVTESGDWLPHPLLPDTRSEMAIPMIIGNELIGVLDVQSALPDYFTLEDASVQATLAAQIGIAIKNASLFTENARRLAIIEHSSDLIALSSIQRWPHLPRYVNPAGLRLLGVESVGALHDLTIDDIFPPEDAALLHGGALETALREGVWRGELTLLSRDRREIPVEQTLLVIRDEQGIPRDVAMIAHDISQRRRDEEALRQANRAYRTLSDCNQVMVRATDETTLLNDVCRIVVDSGRFRMAWVGYAADDEARSITPIASYGADNGYLELLHTTWADEPRGNGPAGRAVRTGNLAIVADCATDPDFEPWREAALARGYRSVLGLPLKDRDHIFGVLVVYAEEADAFRHEEEVTLLDELAHDLAYGITALRTRAERERAQQAEREQRLLAEALSDTATILNSTLELDAVLDRILENIQRVLPHDSASILLVDGADARVARHHGYGTRGLSAWMAARRFPIDEIASLRIMRDTGHPVVIADTETYPDWVAFPETAWIRSYAAAPIQREGDVIGFLTVDSAQPNFFNAQHAERLQTFANQAAIALQNARMFQALQEHAAKLEAQAKRLALLNRISSQVTQQLELDEIYRVVLIELQAVLGASFGGLILFEDHKVGRLVLSTHPDERANRDITIGLEQNPSIDYVRETHKPLVSEDVLNDPRFKPAWPVLRRRGTRTLVIMPLLVGDEVIGTLGLDWVEPRQFSPDELELVETIANQASVAITKAQLLTAEREQRILAEALGDVAALSNRSLSLDDLFDGLLENIRRVIAYDAGNLMLIEHDVAMIVRHTGYEAYGPTGWIEHLRLTGADTRHWSRMHTQAGVQPYIINDTAGDPDWTVQPESAWIRATLKAPISIDNQVIGLLNLDSATPHAFKPIDAERLQAFADHAALAIRNARLFEAEREQRTLAEALRAAAAAITSTLQFDAVLDRILANVGRVLPYDAANIMLIEDGVARVVRGHGYAEHGAGAWIRKLRFKVDEVPVWQEMIATRRPFALPDTHAEPLWMRIPEEDWIRSTVKAPIVLEDRVIGILHLDSTEPGFFDAADAERLQAFADQAAIAIRNAQLYDAVQHHASELELRVRERTAEVEAQRAQLQAVLDSMGEAVIFTLGGQVMYINAAFTELLGYEPDDLIGRSLVIEDSLIAPSPNGSRQINAIRTGLAQQRSWRGDVAALRRDGSTIDAALTITQVPGVTREQDSGLVAIFRDISQEKALQAQKDRFIAHASHELRTPLANIKTRLYLLRRQPDKLSAHLEVIDRVTNSMTELIENLLDISRFERGIIPLYQRPVSLNELVEEVLVIQRAEAEHKAITLCAALPDRPLMVEADPQRMMQVITNLVINAINYTPEGGTVTVELEALEPTAEAEHGRAVLRIRDTGIGIPQEMLAQVFEPFFRANEDIAVGTGLGLTIAREIVNLHRGTVGVESTVGQGSVFTVTLDLIEHSE